MPPRVTSTRRDKEVRKGKKRAISEVGEQETRQREVVRELSSSLTPPPPEEQPKPKRSKKGDTRPCPVCLDDIPVRLLAQHVDLELYRVDELLKSGVSMVVVESAEAGPSATRRGAAVRARKSINPRSNTDLDSLEQVDKTLKLLRKNRKQRHSKLKEIIAQDEDEEDRPLADIVRKGTTCPVCLVRVGGDHDFVDAHVDACLANAQREQVVREQREALSRIGEGVDAWGEVEVNGEMRIRLNNVAGLRGTGIDIRDRTQADVEGDVDVDGDEAEFGDVQFTERDVLAPTLMRASVEDVQVNVDGGEEEVEDGDGGDEDPANSLRALVAQGKVVTRRQVTDSIDGLKAEVEEVMGLADTDRMERAIQDARTSGSSTALVSALENKIKYLESTRVSSSTSSLCRICIDPYNEPTVSTGCWHTCCRECWLRCLGSTKLCPICKRITAATELRRIYM